MWTVKNSNWYNSCWIKCMYLLHDKFISNKEFEFIYLIPVYEVNPSQQVVCKKYITLK